MKRSVALLISALIVGSPVAMSSAAIAQGLPLLFPAESYGRTNLAPRQSTGDSGAMVLQQNAAYEPLHELNPSNPIRLLSNAIGRIDVLLRRADGQEGMATCTGALIDGDRVLTNKHCVPSDNGVQIKEMSIVMNYLKLNDEGERFKIDLPALETDAGLDFAVLGVRGSPSAKYGKVALSSGKVEPGQSLLLIHHPGGRPKVMTRFRCFAHAAQPDGPQLRHRCDTEPGSSGALVFNQNNLETTALHFSGGLDGRDQTSFNIATRLPSILTASRVLPRGEAQAARSGDGAVGSRSAPAAPSDARPATAPPAAVPPNRSIDDINKYIKSN